MGRVYLFQVQLGFGSVKPYIKIRGKTITNQLKGVKMEREEHIGGLIRKSEIKEKQHSEIQDAYEAYFRNGSDADFEALIHVLDDCCKSYVRTKLKMSGCYSYETEQDIMQESRIGVWKLLEKERSGKSISKNFASYAFVIYKNKTLDEIRKCFGSKKKMPAVSLSETIGQDGVEIGDTIPGKKDMDPVDLAEQRELFRTIFLYYCRSFLETKNFPASPLALYYARVMPHLIDMVSENIATSAKWAFGYIGEMKIDEMKTESESFLADHVEKTLRWGEEFVRQMDDLIDVNGDKVRVRDIVYTQNYDQRKIADWSEYMHKNCVKNSYRMIMADKRILGLAVEYISHRDALFAFFKTV